MGFSLVGIYLVNQLLKHATSHKQRTTNNDIKTKKPIALF